MSLFRSAKPGHNPDELNVCKTTARKPGNVEYLVDNLWEWKRPDIYPNRRYSVYASPSIDLARKFGGSGNGVVYEVQLTGKFAIAQTKIDDARYHPDCASLPKLLLKMLGQSWIDSSLEEKEIGQLWIPCLKKNEVETLFKSAPISHLREAIWESITFWDDASTFDDLNHLPHKNGEVFFQPLDGYHLKSIESG
ncbi:hypothetical protein ACFL3W_00090 [Pseudomonadota bacterium]